MYKFRLIFTLFTLFFINSNLFGQSLNLSEINTSNFPNLQVGFTALNRFGDSEKDLKLGEFKVVENGIDVTNTAELECFGGSTPQELNVILVIDKSGSMKKDPYDPKSIRLFDWVEKSVKIFLDEFEFYGRSQVSIIAFAGNSEIRCPFTQNPEEILDSLKRTQLAGPTNYNDPFIGEYNSVVSMYNSLSPDYKSQMKTVVIFLTDGQPSAATPTKQFDIVNEMKKIAVQVFSITLLTEMNAGLDYISEQTGGRATRVDSEQDLIDLYKIIASEIQNKIFCIIKWLAPYGCDPNNLEREVKITFTRDNKSISNTKTYTAPPNSIAKTMFLDDMDLNADMVAFGNPQVGASTTRKFKVYAEISDMNISGLKINPAGPYFTILGVTVKGVTKTTPFVLKQGDTAEVEVQFTQVDKIDYRPANLVFEGTPCERVLPIYGGVSDVVLLTPNTGYFKDCNDIEIRWTGVDKTTPVNIYYSTNDGANWVLLQKDATGFTYTWLKANFPTLGNKFRIKLEVLPISFYQFAKRFGNATENFGRSIAISNDSTNLYFTGYYTGSMSVDNILMTSKGVEDIYIVKSDNVGNILWAKSAGGGARDTASGVAVDEDGNAYIVGTIKKVANEDVQFGGSGASIEYDDLNCFFVAKYDKSGLGTPLVKVIGAKPAYTAFRATGVKIRVTGSGANTRIRAIGRYAKTGGLKFVEGNNTFTLPDKDSEFEAVYDKNMNLLSLVEGPVSQVGFSTDSAYDANNDLKYKIGSFSGTRNFAPYSVTSAGLNDIFFTKYGKNKESIDISSNTFGIEKPTLKFIVPNYDFGPQNFGQANSKKLASLTNTTNLPIKIMTSYIDTDDKTDFIINSIPTIIDGMDTVDIEIDYKPLGVGNRKSKLFIEGECANTINIDLNGEGICNTEGVSLVRVGSTNLNTPKTQITSRIFYNPNDGAIEITPSVINDAMSEFKILSVNGTAYTNTAITVPGFDSVSIEVEFTPKQSGVRTAKIDYKVSNGCNNFTTNLEGIGVDNEVFAETLFFDKKRIQTVNEATIILKNSSSLANKVTNCTLEDNKHFSIKTTLNYPITIPANGEYPITIVFKPLAEVNYKTKLNYTLENSTETFSGEVEGIGTNPQILPELICPPTTPKEGDVVDAYLRLTNSSILDDAKVKDITISGTEYVFKSNGSTFLGTVSDIPFGIANYVDIPLTFSPTGAGMRNVTFNINADVAIGNNVDEKYPVTQLVTTTTGCSVRSLGGEIDVNLGNVLYCDTKVADIDIPTNENVDDLIIDTTTPILITGADASFFSHNIDNTFTPIKFGESRKFKLTFKPDANRLYNARLELPNNLGTKIIYNISANGVVLKLSSSKENDVTFAPGGEGAKLYFSAELPKLDNGPITTLKTRIYYDNKMVYFKIDEVTKEIKKVESNLTGWVWDTPKIISDGIVEVVGNGIINTPINGDLYSMDYKIYLGDKQESEIKFGTQINECIDEGYLGTKVKLGNVCFVNGRLLDLSNVQFATSDIIPNPATSNTKLTIGVGFDVDTKVEIINYLGEVVAIPLNQYTKKGVHEIELPIENLTNGLYIINVVSGPFIESKTFIINK